MPFRFQTVVLALCAVTLAAACNGHPFTYVPIDYFQRLGRSN